jgi:hypothetical protein
MDSKYGIIIKFTKTSIYQDSEIFFFFINKNGIIKVPLYPQYKFIKGYLVSPHNSLLKNMNECFTSCIEGGFDYITGEHLNLKFYCDGKVFSNHNVFTSMFYCLYIMSKDKNREYVNLLIQEFNKIGISREDINNDYFESNNLKLIKIETKIFFWFNFYSKINKGSRLFDDKFYMAFYVWCFNNIRNLNNPKMLTLRESQKNIDNKIKCTQYFRLVDESDDKLSLLMLRYVPCKLTLEEILTKPIKIFTFFSLIDCRNRLIEINNYKIDSENKLNEDEDTQTENSEILNYFNNLFKK